MPQTLPFSDVVVDVAVPRKLTAEPFSRGNPGRRVDRLPLDRLTPDALSALPLVNTLLLATVTALVVVTSDDVDEKTDEQRSDAPASGIHALLRDSDRQLLKRGRGGFGVLPEDEIYEFQRATTFAKIDERQRNLREERKKVFPSSRELSLLRIDARD